MSVETVVVNFLEAIFTPIIMFIDKFLPMDFITNGFIDDLALATYETLVMVLVTGFFSVIFGAMIGIAVVVTKKDGILENRFMEFILDKVINFFRSVPFVILISVLGPLTMFIFHTQIGMAGSFIPLLFGTAPFFARQIEAALSEVDPGLIEASQAMGCSPVEIMFRVYLKESIPGIIRGITITCISLIGLVAMVGIVAGGGLGSFAIRFGWQRQKLDATWATVVIILVIVTIIQWIGNYIIKKTTH